MARISDELRQFIDEEELLPSQIDELRCIADRIDAEMFELPKDRDGVPIHVGNTVYLYDGSADKVKRIGIEIYEDGIYALVFGYNFSGRPEHVSHTKPDSLESIAEKLYEMATEKGQPGYTCERLASLAERIYSLAEKEGER